jgi:hypothetical protein
MSPDSDLIRLGIQEAWRTRVEVARVKYDQAVAEFRRVLKDQRDYPLPSPDGSGAIRKARQEESVARREYIQVLKVFADLIMHGRLPPEV